MIRRLVEILQILHLFSNFKYLREFFSIIEKNTGKRKWRIFSGPILVSRFGDVGWTKHGVKISEWINVERDHKKCCSIKTVWQWSWK